MGLIRAIKLFLKLVFREVEPKDCGIPDEYRIHGRFSPKLAWQVARIMYLEAINAE